jgi:hypothetical protein
MHNWLLDLFFVLVLRLQIHRLGEQVLDGFGHCLQFQSDQTSKVFIFEVVEGKHGVFVHAKLVATLDILRG